MIAIIKYNAGNTTSVKNAVERLGYECCITDNTKTIENATKVILPGVGAAGTAMDYLIERRINKVIVELRQPVLGICLGQQLMCNYSEEGQVSCLGIFDIKVKKFPTGHIVPHMGWNALTEMRGQLFDGIRAPADVYFVHSYYCGLSEHTIALTDYILPFSSALKKDNFYATQFHPEKSAEVGSFILKNFLQL